MHKPHGKDLDTSAVLEVREFITKAGLHPAASSEVIQANPDLLIEVDHHGATLFHVDVASDDPSKHFIQPYDPHHFLHHLVHKDQSRERGQRAPEQPEYYQKIADAVRPGGKIVVVGHGAGKSNAAHHLVEYLKTHRPDTYHHIVGNVVVDLSAITPPQLLEVARKMLRA
jgi:hypothetical protein